MALNYAQNVRDLLERVEVLEKALAREVKLRTQEHARGIYRSRKFRAEIIRLKTGESGERWVVGNAYTRGSYLSVPRKPDILLEVMTMPIRSDTMGDKELRDGSRNGIPPTV